MYLGMYKEDEDYVPMNWDALASNPDVWETIKEEMEDKFGAECLMKIITAAKEAGLKDKDIFLPMEADVEEDIAEEEVDMAEGMPEYASLEEDSIGDTTED